MRRICSSSRTSQQLGVERPRRVEVVAEGLLDHDPGVLGQPGLGEAVDDRGEQRGRDLEVEDRPLGLPSIASATCLKVVGVGVVALDVGEPRRRGARRRPRRGPRRSRRSPRGRARAARSSSQSSIATPTIGQSSLPRRLEPVERPEGHLLGQVAGDPEDRQHVGCGVGVFAAAWPSARQATRVGAVQTGTAVDVGLGHGAGDGRTRPDGRQHGAPADARRPRCVVYDVNPDAVAALAGEGADGRRLARRTWPRSSTAPRAVWVMVPAGEITEKTVDDVAARARARRRDHRRRQLLLPRRHPPRRRCCASRGSTTSTAAPAAASSASSAATA